MTTSGVHPVMFSNEKGVVRAELATTTHPLEMPLEEISLSDVGQTGCERMLHTHARMRRRAMFFREDDALAAKARLPVRGLRSMSGKSRRCALYIVIA